MNKPLVSICCAAYNHEEYMEETLKGFLMQECDFEYEILIHDDASTDKTAKIIRKYEKMYPNKIFPIYQTENQYSQGKKYSDLNYERVRGKYVAICEGDDCWIDKTKLSKQIKLMEQNPTFGLCFHPAVQLNLTNNTKKNIGEYLDKDGVVPIEDIIIKTNGMIPTASCLLTKEVLDEVLEFKSSRPYLTLGDIYIQIFGALKTNGVLYINEVMSLYRYLTPESWSIQWVNSNKAQIRHIKSITKSFQELNVLTEYKYNNAFELSIIKKLFVLPLSNKIEQIPLTFSEYTNHLIDFFKELSLREDEYILYGAGTSSELISSFFKDKIQFVLDIDRLKTGTKLQDKIIYNLDKLSEITNRKIIISIIMRSDEAVENLIKNYNIPQKQIIQLDKILANKNILNSLKF